ncbi:hypothetical protein BN873_950074 [Candidatus Competibacter denitrificans Run_A_D11]|uniref:Uncharacterized protein n=1 Tax=Candidatus Competibacter denitrificans Run_A_D11 TaxID=1400863 RepID=W6M8S9_9GAMM|nr:hypothetical protein BN873_950074 [Candidatus Competibacter denitrificans Run_A_D11]
MENPGLLFRDGRLYSEAEQPSNGTPPGWNCTVYTQASLDALSGFFTTLGFLVGFRWRSFR